MKSHAIIAIYKTRRLSSHFGFKSTFLKKLFFNIKTIKMKKEKFDAYKKHVETANILHFAKTKGLSFKEAKVEYKKLQVLPSERYRQLSKTF